MTIQNALLLVLIIVCAFTLGYTTREDEQIANGKITAAYNSGLRDARNACIQRLHYPIDPN